MRDDPLIFEEYNTSTQREPRIVVELAFDDAATDLYYLTSHDITGLTGNILSKSLKVVSSTSQKINPDKANATIGTIKFEALDLGNNITDTQRTKLLAGDGLRNKRVRIYMGYKQLDFANFQLVQTQIISDSIKYTDTGVYKFSCSDVQRLERQKIFVPKQTAVTQSVGLDDTTINVQDTSEFQAVYQPNTSSGLAPGQDIYVFQIGSGEGLEIIYATGKTATTFTGCVRGVLNTRPIELDVDPSLSTEELPKLEEVIYMEAPAVKIAYAILTGSWYNDPGKFLPDHWTLGVDTQYVKTSDFINIGVDLWDTTNDDAGIPSRVLLETNQDGKKFLEEQIYYALGLYSPVTAQGELGLRRLETITKNGSYDRLITNEEIVNIGDLNHDVKGIINRYLVRWNYNPVTQVFTRANGFADSSSINEHGASPLREVKLRCLYGGANSYETIRRNFRSVESRYLYPLRQTIKLTPENNVLEVGDIVRVQTDKIQDFTASDASLNRNGEVQSVKIDWATGEVSIDVLYNYDLPDEQDPDETETVDKTFLNNNVPLGNYINPTNYPGDVTSSGGVTTVVNPITLTGNTDLNNVNSWFYVPEDFVVNAEITIENNVQIRVDGFTTINQPIDGLGNGYAGGVSGSDDPNVGNPGPGTSALGDAYAQGQVLSSPFGSQQLTPRVRIQSGTTIKETGLFPAVPELNIQIDNDEITGLPETLMGTSGPAGGLARVVWAGVGSDSERGGDGGDSGAGFVLFTYGYSFGANGEINTSGTDGTLGTVASVTQGILTASTRSGTGAGGMPGGVLMINLDSTQFAETINDADFILNAGLSVANTPAAKRDYVTVSADTFSSYYKGYSEVTENLYQSHARLINLDANRTVTPDLPEFVQNDPTFSLTEFTNTPESTLGDQSSVEVSVTPPGDANYSYANVYYREQGVVGWTAGPAASNEGVVQLQSDGKTYEFQVRSVSISGFESPNGPIDTITLTNVNGRTDAELAVLYPFSTITGLALQNEAGSVFSGPEAQFEWNDDNSELTWFNYYEIELYSGAQLLRTEISAQPFYVYTYDKNIRDYKLIEAAEGAYFDIEIRVRPVSRYFNNLSQLYKGSQSTFSVTASNVNDPDNLRFIVSRGQNEQDISDAAGTANWSGVVDDGGRPEDNATQGATWDTDITNQPTDPEIKNDQQEWSDVQNPDQGTLTKLGNNAGTTNQGTDSLALGDDAGASNQGVQSIAVGRQAGQTTQGTSCIAFGYRAGNSSQGNSCVAIGDRAGETTQSTQSVAIGTQAGQTTQGARAVAIGDEAAKNSQGEGAVAIGRLAAGAGSQGAASIAIGREAALNGQGVDAIAIGRLAGGGTSQADWAVAIGYLAGNDTQGTQAVAIGREAGETNQGGSSVAIGVNAGDLNLGLRAIAIGSGSDAIGEDAIAIGEAADGTGLRGVAVGSNSRARATDSSAFGHDADISNVAYTNSTCIGANSGVAGANEVQLGDSATTTYVYGTVQSRSDERDKYGIRDTELGLDFICALRARQFLWDYREDYRENKDQPFSELVSDGSKRRARYHNGLVAQEVKAVMDAMDVDFAGYQDHAVKGGEDVLTLGMGEFIAPMIKAIQELKAELDDLKANQP